MMVAQPQDVGLSADLHPNHGSRVTAGAVVDLILNAHSARTARHSPGPRDHRSIVSAPPRRTRAVGGSCVPAACSMAQLPTVSDSQPRVIPCLPDLGHCT
jgi:hypothetical protein